MVTKLKQLDPTCTQFTANGKTYTIEGLGIDRWVMYQQLQVEAVYGASPQEVWEAWKKQFELVAEQKFGEAVIHSHNQMSAVAKLADGRMPPALKMFCLIANTPDEDRSIITQEMIDAKIEDFRKEGYEMTGFFYAALGSINGFSQIYEESSRGISQSTPPRKDLGEKAKAIKKSFYTQKQPK
jgi:hypothetical protein